MDTYQQLEQAFGDFTGSRYAVSVNTGTAALHLALLAVGAKSGTEVILPDFTMAACAFAVSYTGATPVFVDCDDRLLMDVGEVANKITDKTVAIMPVHIYGRLCDVLELKKFGLPLVEDASEATGAVYESVADVTCYSLYRNKIVCAEEGGIITTNNKDIAKTANFLKNMAFSEAHDFTHNAIGFNYRLSNGQASMALDSLDKYSENLNSRWEMWEKHALSYSSVFPKPQAPWVYDFLTEQQDEFVLSHLQARYFFKPMTSLPMYRARQGKNSTYYSKRGVYLPLL